MLQLQAVKPTDSNQTGVQFSSPPPPPPRRGAAAAAIADEILASNTDAIEPVPEYSSFREINSAFFRDSFSVISN